MRILNFGGGQQSTALYLLAAERKIEPIDYAIFADTGEEPQWVYQHLQQLIADGRGAPILIRQRLDKEGNQIRLGDQIVEGEGKTGRFASIPAFLKYLDQFEKRKPAQGKGKRQCTREFKIDVVTKTIRYELLGLKYRQKYTGPRVTQLFGFDTDEGGRIVDTQVSLARERLAVGEFPLFDLGWTRLKCVEYLDRVWGREVLSSACVFCPLTSNKFRRLIRDRDPEGHARGCQVDRAIRLGDSVSRRGLNAEIYVHRTMIPLESVDLDRDEPEFDFMPGCEGYCGH